MVFKHIQKRWHSIIASVEVSIQILSQTRSYSNIESDKVESKNKVGQGGIQN